MMVPPCASCSVSCWHLPVCLCVSMCADDREAPAAAGGVPVRAVGAGPGVHRAVGVQGHGGQGADAEGAEAGTNLARHPSLTPPSPACLAGPRTRTQPPLCVGSWYVGGVGPAFWPVQRAGGHVHRRGGAGRGGGGPHRALRRHLQLHQTGRQAIGGCHHHRPPPNASAWLPGCLCGCCRCSATAARVGVVPGGWCSSTCPAT